MAPMNQETAAAQPSRTIASRHSSPAAPVNTVLDMLSPYRHLASDLRDLAGALQGDPSAHALHVDATRKVKILEDQVRISQTKYNKACKESDASKGLLREEKDRVRDLEETLAKLKGEFQELQDNYKKQQDTYNTVQAKFTKKFHAFNVLSREHDRLLTDKESWGDVTSSMITMIKRKDSHIQGLSSDCSRFQEDLLAFSRAQEELHVELAEVKKEKKDLEEQVEDLEEKIEELEDELGDDSNDESSSESPDDGEWERLESANKELETQNEQLKSHKSILISKTSRLRADKECLVGKIAERDGTIKLQKSQEDETLAKHTATIVEKDNIIQDLRRQLKDLRNQESTLQPRLSQKRPRDADVETSYADSSISTKKQCFEDVHDHDKADSSQLRRSNRISSRPSVAP